MNLQCPQCGAQLRPGETCRERFDASQVQEMEQADYGAVHHLSILCYMLQHNVYSAEGWLAARELLSEFVSEGLTPERARRQNRRHVDSGHRSWSLTKGAKLAGVEGIEWTRTVADVRLDTAEIYCADVRAWAKSVLDDSHSLAAAHGGGG